ncbi:MAG: TIM barrel protein [Mesorhizobium sp.]|nr:TIM barrel protein [Mesorhizobium sp.]
MPRLAANLSTMFRETPFLERFERAAKAGFSAVEFQFAYVFDPADIRSRLIDNGLTAVLFNTPAGDWDRGERGLAALPARRDEYRTGVGQAIDLALELCCTRLHTLAGIVAPGADPEAMRRTYVDNLRFAAQFAAMSGIEMLIEPISEQAMPGYFLSSLAQAADIIDEAGEENLFIQYDLYHRRFEGPDLIAPLETHADTIRHVQIAGWPDRHEPGEGDPGWRGVFEALDLSDYAGFVGCEYFPAGRTEDGLGWARPWLRPAGEGTA